MIKTIRARIQQGYRTMPYPETLPVLPDRFRGLPSINVSQCAGNGCTACSDACPTGAISLHGSPSIDLGKCLFCPACERACPSHSITFSRDHKLASNARNGLVIHGDKKHERFVPDPRYKKLFSRSLTLRQVSAGGCNACEADINVLSTIGWDLGRFGIQIVASPRHADGIIVTGPVTGNMLTALKKTWDATPDPRIVIAVGSCALSGGPFVNCSEHHGGVETILPVDLYIPGCPPHPLTILDGILRLLGRVN